MTREELYAWNQKLYPEKEHLQAEWFWDNFKIKSAPKFEGFCWSHIPKTWEAPVAILLSYIQAEYGDKIQFIQIKEKFIELVIYFKAENKEIEEKVREAIKLTQDELRDRGLHI